MEEKLRSHIKESPWSVTAPLLLLAIPSAAAGGLLVETMLFGDFFAGAIVVSPDNDTVAVVRDHAQGSALTMLQHGATNPALWAAVAGMVFAMWLYAGWPSRTAMFAGNPLHTLLKEKYFLDAFNDWFFAGGARRLGGALWKKMDAGLIDGFFVNGAARTVAAAARTIRRLQSGAIYHYAFLMLSAVALILLWRAGEMKLRGDLNALRERARKE